MTARHAPHNLALAHDSIIDPISVQIADALCSRLCWAQSRGRVMTAAGGQGRSSRKEHTAKIAVGMPADHPELLTRKPSRAVRSGSCSPPRSRTYGRTTSTRRSLPKRGA